MAYWAYDFVCDQPIEALLASLNAAGPWRWGQRESGVFGDYLNTRPQAGVRLRVHFYPQMGDYGMFTGLRDKGCSALLEIEADSAATKPEIDLVFRGLLQIIAATDIIEIEPYD